MMDAVLSIKDTASHLHLCFFLDQRHQHNCLPVMNAMHIAERSWRKMGKCIHPLLINVALFAMHISHNMRMKKMRNACNSHNMRMPKMHGFRKQCNIYSHPKIIQGVNLPTILSYPSMAPT